MSERTFHRDCGDGIRRADAGSISPTAVKTTAYTILPTDAGKTFANTGAVGSVALTLPTAVEGFFFRVLKTVSGQTIVITRKGSETIDGVAGNLTLPSGCVGLFIIASDGTNWYTDYGIQSGQSGDVTSTVAGVTTIGAGKVLSGMIDPGVIQLATVNVSSAELLALFTTAKQLIAAPGANKILELISASCTYIYNSVVYTINGSTNLSIKYKDKTGADVTTTRATTGFIDQATNQFTIFRPTATQIAGDANAVNQPLCLALLVANPTLGDGTLKVNVVYRVHTLV